MVFLWIFHLKWPLVPEQWMISGEFHDIKWSLVFVLINKINFKKINIDLGPEVTSGLLMNIKLYVTPGLFTVTGFWWISILLNNIRWPQLVSLFYRLAKLLLHWFRARDDLWSLYIYIGWLLIYLHLQKLHMVNSGVPIE